jgi:hypothetical protein
MKNDSIDAALSQVLKQMEKTEGAEIKRMVAQAIIDTMPAEVRANAATSPDAVIAAIEQAMEISNKIAVQMMFLFITEPDAGHKAELSVGSLAALCRDKGVALRAGEVEKDDKIGFRPTQKTGQA